MSDIKQAYETLGLEVGASLKEIMEAHRDLAVVWDPRPHENNPRLHRKATENLGRINQAFQLLREQHLGAQTGPGEESEEALQPGPEIEERESSLYEEIFSERKAETKRRIPIWFIAFVVIALVIILSYWGDPDDQDQAQLSNPAPGSQQPPEGVLEVEIKDGTMQVPSREPSAAAAGGELEAAVESAPEISPSESPPSEPPPVPRPKSESAPKKEIPLVAQNTPEPSNKPVLQRGATAADEEAETPASPEAQEDERSLSAFQMLKDKSAAAQKLIEGDLSAKLSYQEWETVQAREPEFWIDLIAHRSTDGGELHLIWSVNTDTGEVIPMSQAARDLDAELLQQPDC